LKELLRAAFSQFEKNQIASVDAELLLAHLLGISRKQIHAQDLELADGDREKIAAEYADLINQRLLGRPVQYIAGSAALPRVHADRRGKVDRRLVALFGLGLTQILLSLSLKVLHPI
jgi:methylase of polypeptide subunit release factors